MYEYKLVGGDAEDLVAVLNLHGNQGWRSISLEWETVDINDHQVREWAALLERERLGQFYIKKSLSRGPMSM
jgi:hypothetical protein